MFCLRRCLRRYFAGLLLVAAGSAHAAGAAPDLPTRTLLYSDQYRLNADGTFEETVDLQVRILTAEGVERGSRTGIDYNRSTQHPTILAAYTGKPDGRHINAPAGNIRLDVQSSANNNGVEASDYTAFGVVFPDVEIGDTVVLQFRLATTTPLFPGHFSIVSTVPPGVAFDAVVYRIDAPAALWAQAQATGMTETLNVEQDGRRVREWKYANPHPAQRWQGEAYEPRAQASLSFSTFRNYADIAQAYGVRANQKAAVTPRIRQLAEQITAGKSGQHDQAAALYDWVAQNVEFSGNCIGLGAVVPRDTDYVIDNKTGDCKDHATLLQALLAARGIRSSQALINAGDQYSLPPVPAVSIVNHVITYLPDLGLFADSTNAEIPFGMLPFADQDKPVILVDGYRDGVKTPPAPPGSNEQVMKTRVTVSGDGTMTGMVEVRLRGVYAAMSRAQFRDLPEDAREDFMRNMFSNGGHLGSGTLKAEDARPRLPAYQYASSFQVFGLMPLPAAGSFGIYPLMVSPAPVAAFAGDGRQGPIPLPAGACTNGHSDEEYVFELPKGIKVTSLPADVKLAEGALSYASSYALAGNVLTVRRTLDDRTPGNLCSPAVLAAKRAFAARVQADLVKLVVYQ